MNINHIVKTKKTLVFIPLEMLKTAIMPFLSRLLTLVLFFSVVGYGIGQVRGVTVIICGDRTINNNTVRTTTTKAAIVDSFYCYPGAAAVTLPDECNSGTVVVAIELDPADFFAGDVLTLLSLSNINFEDGTEVILDTLDTSGQLRPALLADENGRMEIEFTRDPLQPSQIVLRNVNSGAGQTINIPACTGTVFNGNASAIPTVGQWGILSLGLILLIFGVVALHKYAPLRAAR